MIDWFARRWGAAGESVAAWIIVLLMLGTVWGGLYLLGGWLLVVVVSVVAVILVALAILGGL